MANHKSAAKRARQNIRKKKRNHSNLSKVKTTVKHFLVALEGFTKGECDEATTQKAWSHAQAILHRAASKGIMHRNGSNRRISRLNQAFRRAKDAQAQA